jgi:hypothetical protein
MQLRLQQQLIYNTHILTAKHKILTNTYKYLQILTNTYKCLQILTNDNNTIYHIITKNI